MSKLSSRMWHNLLLFEKRTRIMLSLSAIALISILFTVSAVCFVRSAIHRSSKMVIRFETVPQSLIEKGLTDRYFAQLLADQLDSINRSSGTCWFGRLGYVADLSSERTNVSFEVGGSGLTLSVALSALYDLFGVREQRAIGYVVEARDSAYFRIRLTSASKTFIVEKRIPISQLVSGGQVSHDLAEQVMGVLDAFTLASYKFQFDLDSSRQIAEGCLSDEWRDNDSWALNLLGIIEFTKENYEVAVSFYHRAFRANPQFLSAILNLANAFAESGQCDSSEFYCLRASNIGYKDKANLFGNWALSRHKCGNDSSAIKFSQHALEIGSTDWRLLLNHAIISKSLNVQNNVDHIINQALLNGGDTSKILLTEAGFELSRGDTDRAIVIYDELSKTHPLVAQVWYDYACVKGVLGDTLSEERYYKESIRLDSTYWRAWHNIGVLYLDRHDLVNAKIALERAIVLNPKNQKVNAALAELYREANEKLRPRQQ